MQHKGVSALPVLFDVDAMPVPDVQHGVPPKLRNGAPGGARRLDVAWGKGCVSVKARLVRLRQ